MNLLRKTPTHLDAHMVFYYWRPGLMDVLVDVALEKKLPLLVHGPAYIQQCACLMMAWASWPCTRPWTIRSSRQQWGMKGPGEQRNTISSASASMWPDRATWGNHG